MLTKSFTCEITTIKPASWDFTSTYINNCNKFIDFTSTFISAIPHYFHLENTTAHTWVVCGSNLKRVSRKEGSGLYVGLFAPYLRRQYIEHSLEHLYRVESISKSLIWHKNWSSIEFEIRRNHTFALDFVSFFISSLLYICIWYSDPHSVCLSLYIYFVCTRFVYS